MALSIGGLGSGLDTASIVAQLMATERIPQSKVQAAGQAAQKQVTAWNELRTKVQSLLTAAEALRTPAKAVAPTATSSSPAVRVTAGETAVAGQTSFHVKRLATAEQRVWPDAGSPAMTVGAGRSVLVAGALGTGATAQSAEQALDLSGAAAGVHTVSVTRASSAAAAWTSAPASLSATDLTITLGDGSTQAITLASGYASAEAMRDDLRSKVGPGVVVDVTGGRVEIRTADEGASRSLAFGGGAAAALGLPTTAVTGQNAVVVANGKRQEVEPQPAGTAGTLDVPLGDTGVVLRVGDSLRTGTLKANVVETTSTDTLTDLANKLSAAGSPLSATLVSNSDGTTSLRTTATATGQAGAVRISTAGHDLLAAAPAPTAGLDAEVVLGTDPNGPVHTRSSNTISDLVPGLTIDLLYKPQAGPSGVVDPVTATVSRDTTGAKDKVKALVDAMNGLLNDVKSKTRYDVASRTGGPLVGNGVARGLSLQLFSQTAGVTPSGDLRTLAQLGISTTRDGTFQFDAATLTKALETAPEDVARVIAGTADKLAVWAKETSQTGGVLTSQRDGADAEVTDRRKQSDAMEVRLKRVEERYRRQFSALDVAMSQLNAQRSAMSSALAGFL